MLYLSVSLDQNTCLESRERRDKPVAFQVFGFCFYRLHVCLFCVF